MSFEELRKKHPEFIYHGFEIKEDDQDLKVYFDFEISPGLKFRPEIVLLNIPQKINPQVINNLVFNLGMVELLSYWKATCSPKVIVKTGFLDEDQIKFWKKLLIKGMGEFFFNNQAKFVSSGNKIDFTREGLVEFVIMGTSDSSGPEVHQNDRLSDRDLVLVGGGKDSAVTLEEVSKKGGEFNCLLLNPTDAALKITEISGCKNPIIAKRKIDPKLIELNTLGYLNGHTPFSAYLAFLGALVGVIYDYKNIIVSNESSSSEGNVIWMGQEINHQYSKTEEFEKDFKEYSQKYLAPINFYSYLREFNELQISEKFSKIEKYHLVFRSCNKGAKLGLWCGECPKCLSTYLTLFPYLGPKTTEIFGKDLLNDEKLIPLLKGLLRENDVVKPFECVATVDEIKTAIKLSKQKAQDEGLEVSKLLQNL